jgi:hypothetical protein
VVAIVSLLHGGVTAQRADFSIARILREAHSMALG